MAGYIEVETINRPLKMWTNGVMVESQAMSQLMNIASLPIIHKHVAVMPDVHLGKGATVGSVIATRGAIIPAAVGVDIGCGMNAVRLSIRAEDLPDNLKQVRSEIETMIPVGFEDHSPSRLGIRQHRDTQRTLNNAYSEVSAGLDAVLDRHPGISKMAKDVDRKVWRQIGTLGGGNHFVELCIDENDDVWVMLHSGSRGIGNCIGRYFIELARKDLEQAGHTVPDRDLSYLREGTSHYDDYVQAVEWAQSYARKNREIMMDLTLIALSRHLPDFVVTQEAVNTHHNYVNKETHYGDDVWVTRKGAISAQKDELGIIPGSMGAKSFIVRGKGNCEAFCSAPHGAGRIHSRGASKKLYTVEDLKAATEGIECRKDAGIIDEIPHAYKNIDEVIASSSDLVEVVHTLRQVLNVKG